MNPVLKAALDECDQNTTTNGRDLLDVMRGKRALLDNGIRSVLTASTGRELRQSDRRDIDVVRDRIASVDERIAELEYDQRREGAAAETRRLSGEAGRTYGTGLMGGYVNDAATYNPGPDSPSFFKDLIHAQRGDWAAAERLQRNNREVGLETRALCNTGAVGGSGGEFAPPSWLTDEFIRLARPGRVTADLFHHEPMPAGSRRLTSRASPPAPPRPSRAHRTPR